MNILFFLLPKDKTQYVLDTNTLRQVIEKMDNCGYTSIPILNTSGNYVATITEGDILRYVKSKHNLSLKSAEKVNIMKLSIKREVKAINIYANIEDLIELALEQNFVPIVDDANIFIGIVTRKSIISYFKDRKFK